MSELTTFILMDRNITNWRWYKDANTVRLFFHLLLKANATPKEFEGYTIHRGELATSYERLASDLGLSPKQCRTALNHLKKTGEVATKRASKFTIIKVLKYEDYQDYKSYMGKDKGNQKADRGQSKGSQRATTNTDNTVNTVNTDNKRVLSPEEIEEIRRQ